MLGWSALPKETTMSQDCKEKHRISLKILHQVGFEPAQQAATLEKRQRSKHSDKSLS